MNVKRERILLIVPDSLGEICLSAIETLMQLDSVYIFPQKKHINNNHWSSTHVAQTGPEPPVNRGCFS